MNTTYKFAPVPSNSTVADLVTVLVSAWFLVAGAAIFVSSPATEVPREMARSVEPAPTAQRIAPVAIAPEARLTIVVEAPRLRA